MTFLFFDSFPFPSGLTRRGSTVSLEDSPHRDVLRTVDCEHYRAVRTSGGTHMLFTDPAPGLVCPGSVAPLGGPTKPIRKVCMIPPEGISTLTGYRPGHDLRWGVCVVAAYEDGRVGNHRICTHHGTSGP